MKVGIDYFVNKVNINKEDLERLKGLEIRKAFEKAIDIAKGYGLRKRKFSIYTFTEQSREVNLTSLEPNFEIESCIISNIFSGDKTRQYYYDLIYEEDGNVYMVLPTYFNKGDTITIIYEIPYSVEEDNDGNKFIDISQYDFNILELIFEGCLMERIGMYYSKLSMKEIGSDITTNLDRARFYIDQSSRYLSDASGLIKKRIPTGKSINYRVGKEWLTHL